MPHRHHRSGANRFGHAAGRRVDEVECIIADIAGVARGKAMPAAKFAHQTNYFLPNSIFLQTITGEWADNPFDAFTEPDMILEPDWSTATEECLLLLSRFAGDGRYARQPNLGFLYLTEPLAPHAEQILTLLKFRTGIPNWVGATGDDGDLKKDMWEYDSATDSWSQKADFGGTARKDAVAFSIGTKGIGYC